MDEVAQDMVTSDIIDATQLTSGNQYEKSSGFSVTRAQNKLGEVNYQDNSQVCRRQVLERS